MAMFVIVRSCCCCCCCCCDASSDDDDDNDDNDDVVTTLLTSPLPFVHFLPGVIPSANSSALYQHTAHPHTCTILGAPMTYGQPFVGTDTGPDIIRQAGLRNMLTALGWRVEDLPDLDFDEIYAKTKPATTTSHPNNNNSNISTSWSNKAKNSQIVGSGCQQLAHLVASKLQQGRFPLILGGDHSIGIGSLAGILQTRPDTGVLWIDAHADLNTPAISESGNMHGMPVGIMMKGVGSTGDANNNNNNNNMMVPGLEWLMEPEFAQARLTPDSLVYVGLRDVDPAERELIRSLGIAAYTMHEIDRYGIGRVMEMALEHLLSKNTNRPLHLSYDIDAVDPVLAPATGTAVRGGLTFREAHFVAEAVAQTGNLASAEIVELNPSLSHDEGAQETAELGLQIITSLMGKSII